MATSRVTLDKTQYVRVNFGLNPIVVEASEGVVHVAITENQPALNNKAFHRVSDLHPPLHLIPDSNVWVLATSDVQKAVVTEGPSTETRITDRQNRSAKISQKGELLTGSNIDDVDINFQYTIRSVEVVETLSGTGVTSHPGVNGSYAELSPGTGVGSAQLVSRTPVRYRAGHESYCEISTIYRTPEANLNQWYGYLNGNDRWLVGYQGLDLGLMFREGGNDTFIDRNDFSIDKLDGSGPSRYTLNPQNINVFRLAFVWHGGLPLTVEIQVGQQFYPVHTLDLSNLINETHLENPHLPIGGLIERISGTGTDEAMRTGSWRGGAIASTDAESTDDWTSRTTLDASLVTNQRTNIHTLVNPTTWQGKQNHIVYELGVITFDSQANKTVAVYGTKGATITGGGTEVFIDESNYALKYIEGGTVTGGSRGPATVIKGGGERRTDVRGTGIFVYPGEAFTIEVDPGGAVNGTFSVSSRLIHEG